jgi:4,5-DOPA dioxygenase extradiol
MTERMPVLFLGHGSPLNAIGSNAYSQAWARLGASLPRPAAILAVSAHWYLPGTRVTAMSAPRTIHDFRGFPEKLYEIDYPAPGSPKLAQRVQEILDPLPVAADSGWGLDHGTWAVLCHVYPEADVPVVQLSIDSGQPPAFHFEMGRRLGALRDEGILIVGSGNIVHNLSRYAWGREPAAPYPWAGRFEAQVRQLLERRDDEPLVGYESLGEDARLAVPTPEHYLPLLYVDGARRDDDRPDFPVAGIEGGSVSMLSVLLDRSAS